MKKPRQPKAALAAGTPAAAFVAAAVTTHTPWLHALALATAALPWLGALTWRSLFARKPPAVRRDLLELARIEARIEARTERGA
ncbi:hypothetical protein [Streptomyces cacaoi]|uniref:Uncharacterized protein n=2 Tax=Streptomyces cacaoi TaxID=1898 RepID=A0A4Y3RAZ4_STRCI|nr:hypothetical protein [Streptomyces cacaoi]NNG89446.1 hypothetical protein [Streptomyces cacaoi]GEB53843.1 hypothetical protein SCA03_63940 [Streptomyces cacaoi]